MPLLKHRDPAYRCHVSGQAIVTVGGKDHYLGPHNSRSSRERYDSIVGLWRANGRRISEGSPNDHGLTIVEMVVDYIEDDDVKSLYRSCDGTFTSEMTCIKHALSPLVDLFGNVQVQDFGPKKLENIRKLMIEKNWARTTINKAIDRIRRVFKWAVSKELCSPIILDGLRSVSGLRRGKSKAKELPRVKPVSELTVNQTLVFLGSTVKAMVRLQLLTGARPGEICSMKMGDIDRTSDSDLWIYRPRKHKNEFRDQTREIFLGKRSQEILQPFLTMNSEVFLFSPAKSEDERRTVMTQLRKTPINYGNRSGTNRRKTPLRKPGHCYDVASYRRAIARACAAAFPPPPNLERIKGESHLAWKERLTTDQKQELRRWNQEHRWHPHQLRHTAATKFRAERGVEAAQQALGHQTIDATQIYAEKNRQIYRELVLRMG